MSKKQTVVKDRAEGRVERSAKATPNLKRKLSVGLIALGVLTLAVFPLTAASNPYYEALFGKAMIWGILAGSLGFLVGQSGLVSFGHAAWYGFGAYAGGLINIYITSDILASLMLVAVLTTFASVVCGLVLTRLSGISFAILTLALGQVVYSAVFVFSRFTGGEDGLNGVPLPTLLGVEIGVGYGFYLLIVGVLVLTLIILYVLAATPMGSTWKAIRENELRSRFIGIRVYMEKLVIYALTSVLASMAGVLYVAFNGAVSPELLQWQQSGEVLVAAITGGTGTIVGPALGGAAVYLLHQTISASFRDWPIVLGVGFILVIILLPQGIGGLMSRRERKS